MTDSYVETTPGGSTNFVGPDATRLFQARVVRKGLQALKKGLKLNRMYTSTNLLRTAGNITGQTYKRGRHDDAIAGLEAWIAAMECALPVVERAA